MRFFSLFSGVGGFEKLANSCLDYFAKQIHKFADGISPKYRKYWYHQGFADGVKYIREAHKKEFEILRQAVEKYKGLTPRSKQNRKAQRYMSLHRKRRSILEVSNKSCVYCGNEATTIDHIIPLSRGGHDGETNLVPCCLSCNQKKGNKTLAEWRALD